MSLVCDTCWVSACYIHTLRCHRCVTPTGFRKDDDCRQHIAHVSQTATPIGSVQDDYEDRNNAYVPRMCDAETLYD